MSQDRKNNRGIKLLVKNYKNRFRCPENINFYSAADFKKAEKKYVKFCLNGKLDIEVKSVS
jgi:transcription elongation factor Elf1